VRKDIIWEGVDVDRSRRCIDIDAAEGPIDIIADGVGSAGINIKTADLSGGDIYIDAGIGAGAPQSDIFIRAQTDLTLTAGANTSGAFAISGQSTNSSMTVSGGDLTIDVNTSGTLKLQGEDGITIATDMTGDNEVMSLLTDADDPTGGVAATVGSLLLRDVGGAGTTGQVWIKTGALDTAWTQVSTGTGSLQDAYEDGNTITTAAGEGDLAFTTGDSQDITFTLTDGSFLATTSATGDITFDNGASNWLAIDHSAGTTTLNGIAGALTLGTVTSGAVDIAPASGSNATVTTLAAGDIQLDGAAGVYIESSAGTLNMGADDIDQNVNIGTNGERTIAIGNTNGTTGVDIDAGTGGIALDTAVASNFTVSGAAADLTLGARGATITLNENGETTLSGFTATSIVGALNELKDAEVDVVVTVTTGEAYAIGDAIALNSSDGKAYKTDSTTSNADYKFIGVAKEVSGGVDETKTVIVGGEVTSTTDFATFANGDYLYLSTTTGALSNSAPSTSGQTVLKVGVVTDQANDKFLIQVGTPVNL